MLFTLRRSAATREASDSSDMVRSRLNLTSCAVTVRPLVNPVTSKRA